MLGKQRYLLEVFGRQQGRCKQMHWREKLLWKKLLEDMGIGLIFLLSLTHKRLVNKIL